MYEAIPMMAYFVSGSILSVMSSKSRWDALVIWVMS